jgi:hypothetical protein
MPVPALPLLKGTLDLLVLRALFACTSRGYGIATLVEQRTDGVWRSKTPRSIRPCTAWNARISSRPSGGLPRTTAAPLLRWR